MISLVLPRPSLTIPQWPQVTGGSVGWAGAVSDSDSESGMHPCGGQMPAGAQGARLRGGGCAELPGGSPGVVGSRRQRLADVPPGLVRAPPPAAAWQTMTLALAMGIASGI